MGFLQLVHLTNIGTPSLFAPLLTLERELVCFLLGNGVMPQFYYERYQYSTS